MKKIVSLIAVFIILTFGLHNCKSPGNAVAQQTLEEVLGKGILQHFDEMNHCVDRDEFVSFIGNTNDKVEFKENGKVYLQLCKNNGIFDISQLQQKHRLSDFKKFIQSVK